MYACSQYAFSPHSTVGAVGRKICWHGLVETKQHYEFLLNRAKGMDTFVVTLWFGFDLTQV